MAKLKSSLLLAMLSLLIAICSAKNTCSFQTEHVPIYVKAGTQHSGDNKSSNISASISGHTLTIIFTANMGEVLIRIDDENGSHIDCEYIETPNGYIYYIPLDGRYTVEFYFSDGDEYYGVFDVTN